VPRSWVQPVEQPSSIKLPTPFSPSAQRAPRPHVRKSFQKRKDARPVVQGYVLSTTKVRLRTVWPSHARVFPLIRGQILVPVSLEHRGHTEHSGESCDSQFEGTSDRVTVPMSSRSCSLSGYSPTNYGGSINAKICEPSLASCTTHLFYPGSMNILTSKVHLILFSANMAAILIHDGA
jgi:hypothetical protein